MGARNYRAAETPCILNKILLMLFPIVNPWDRTNVYYLIAHIFLQLNNPLSQT